MRIAQAGMRRIYRETDNVISIGTARLVFLSAEWRRARRTAIATVHITCGLPCAGKTTLARQLEQQHHALRLTPDEWIMGIFGSDISVEEQEKPREKVEALLRDLADRVLVLGIDVVLDFGLWARAEREEYRARAARLGARSELYSLDVPMDELAARLAARNADLPAGTFRIMEEQLREYATWFEPPAADELAPREPSER